MTDYHLKTGDTAPSPRTQLLDGDGLPVNLTGATVLFKARTAPGDTPLIDAAGVVEAGTVGWVHYDPTAPQVTAAGEWLVEWQVTYSGGKIQTFPGDGYDTLIIAGDLDTAPDGGVGGYCTISEARAAGAIGTDVEVEAAILLATERIDRFCRTGWAVRA